MSGDPQRSTGGGLRASGVLHVRTGTEPTHRHRRCGTRYVVLSREVRAQCSTGPIADDEMLVLYADVDSGHMSVRPPCEFDDGRFEEIGATTPAATTSNDDAVITELLAKLTSMYEEHPNARRDALREFMAYARASAQSR